MALRELLEVYYEMFGSGYPNIQLGNDEQMIKKCIETKTEAEVLYKDKFQENVEY
mgnify:CR=1 FL=1